MCVCVCVCGDVCVCVGRGGGYILQLLPFPSVFWGDFLFSLLMMLWFLCWDSGNPLETGLMRLMSKPLAVSVLMCVCVCVCMCVRARVRVCVFPPGFW